MHAYKPDGLTAPIEPAPNRRTRHNPDFIFDPEASDAQQRTQGAEPGPIRAWSYSLLKIFEDCRYRAYLQAVKKWPQPTSASLDRGTRLHALCETYVKEHTHQAAPDLVHIQTYLERARGLYPTGVVRAEEEWAFDSFWNVTDWRSADAWLRLKLDCLIYQSDSSVEITDYKTGRRSGNELKHGEQLMLYTVAAFQHDPDLEFINVQNLYI